MQYNLMVALNILRSPDSGVTSNNVCEAKEMRLGHKLFVSAVVALSSLAPVAWGVERVYAGSRDARDLRLWLADQPRGAGIRVGGIVWQPTVPVGLRYDDNIFARDLRKDDDGLFSVTPSLLAKTHYGEHELAISAYSRSDFGFEHSRQDNTEYGGSARAKMQLLSWLDFVASYSFDHLAEDWDSPDIPLDAAEQPEVEQVGCNIGLQAHLGRWATGLNFMCTDVTYNDVARLGGGEINERFRNRDIVDVFIDFSYQLTNTLQPYIQLVWSDNGYDDWPIDRDGGGKSAFLGFRFQSGEALDGNLYGGYVFRNGDDDDFRLKEAEGVGFGAEFNWRVNEQLGLHLDALREIEEATTDLESGRFTTTVALHADHKMTGNLTLQGYFGYEDDEYVGTPREENRYTAGLAVLGTFGQGLYSRLAYRYDTRDSNFIGRSYDRNQILLTVGYKR